MPCYQPLDGFRGYGGKWVSRRDQAPRPAEPLRVPCGRCTGCRLEHSRQWAVRAMHEAAAHPENSFVTLTYDDDHLPKFGLVRRDAQLFLKRLRRGRPGRRIRFFGCGEYTDKWRPHFHLCLFGIDFHEDRERLPKPSKSGLPLWTSPELQERWGKGFVSVGELTFESAAYVARYCTKKITGPLARSHYPEAIDESTGEVQQLPPEHSMMSLRPGIGADWLTTWSTEVYPSDQVFARGQLAKPPRYYDRLLERQNPALAGVVLARRQLAAEAASLDADNTRERLRVREKCARARLNLFARD